MKYSVFTVCMPEFPMVKVPALLKEWGYDGVEWRVEDQIESEKPTFWDGNRTTVLEREALPRAAEIKKLCKDAGIQIPSLATYCGCEHPKRVAYLMEAAVAMGTKSLRISGLGYNETMSFNKRWKEAKKQYDKVEKMAQKFGVRSLVEMHPNTMTASASSALRFVESMDPKYVGVIYDVGNQTREGFENFRAGFEILGKYLAHVHMKNTKWVPAGKDADGKTKWAQKPASLKDGLMNVELFMEVFVKQGYDGWISLEDFTKTPSKRKLVDDLKYLKVLEARARAKAKK